MEDDENCGGEVRSIAVTLCGHVAVNRTIKMYFITSKQSKPSPYGVRQAYRTTELSRKYSLPRLNESKTEMFCIM